MGSVRGLKRRATARSPAILDSVPLSAAFSTFRSVAKPELESVIKLRPGFVLVSVGR